MDQPEDKTRDHGIRMLKILAVAGWVLAAASLWLGSTLLTTFHRKNSALRKENERLQERLERERTVRPSTDTP